MSTTLLEYQLDFKFNSPEERYKCSVPKGAKILKNNHIQDNPLRIFVFFEGRINGKREDFIFLLAKQTKSTTAISENIKLESEEHIKTFTNKHGTFHLFKLNNE